jgi:hypothetical protein
VPFPTIILSPGDAASTASCIVEYVLPPPTYRVTGAACVLSEKIGMLDININATNMIENSLIRISQPSFNFKLKIFRIRLLLKYKKLWLSITKLAGALSMSMSAGITNGLE